MRQEIGFLCKIFILTFVFFTFMLKCAFAQNDKWCEKDPNHPLCVCEKNPQHPTCCCVPVELVSFDSKESKEGIKLTWKTASEQNNDYFTIKLSSNGIDSKEAIRVKGSGTTIEEKNYTYSFKGELPSSLVYFQLWQTDFDGTTKMIGITAIKNNSREIVISEKYYTFGGLLTDKEKADLIVRTTNYRTYKIIIRK